MPLTTDCNKWQMPFGFLFVSLTASGPMCLYSRAQFRNYQAFCFCPLLYLHRKLILSSHVSAHPHAAPRFCLPFYPKLAFDAPFSQLFPQCSLEFKSYGQEAKAQAH